jgi:alkylation response protein AidB-like acyl-CoA dehydrogenase
VNERVVGEHHKELFTKRYVKHHKEYREYRGEYPRDVYDAFGALGFSGADILADHGNCGVLYAH